MSLWRKSRPLQFNLRSMLGSMTWLALVIAVCVAHQQAAARQRVAIEQLKANGLLPVTIVNSQKIPPKFQPHPGTWRP